MIRSLATELLNRILILIILMIKSFLKKKLMVCVDNFSALFSVPELNKVEICCSVGL
jgi:hypothetical protein